MAQDLYPILIRHQENPLLPPLVVKLTKKEKDVIDIFLQTGSIKQVSNETNVGAEDVRAFLGRPDIARYLSTRVLHAAHCNDLTPEKIACKINEIVDSDGKKAYDSTYIRALEIAAKITKLLKPETLTVNLNSENPLASVSDEDLDKKIKERLDAIRPRTEEPITVEVEPERH